MSSNPVNLKLTKTNYETLSLIGSVLLPYIVDCMNGSMRLEKQSENSLLILDLPFKNEMTQNQSNIQKTGTGTLSNQLGFPP